MEEDLRHIDLIDKYLSNSLTSSEVEMVEKRIAEDASFAKELEIYKQIYKGIEQQGDTALKERLASYYNSYKEENESKTNKGRYHKLVVFGSGIAACVLIGLLLFFYYRNDGQNPNFKDINPTIVDIDTVQPNSKDTIESLINEDRLVQEEKPEQINKENQVDEELVNQEVPKDKPKDTVLPDNVNNDTQLAFGGFIPLPPESVRTIEYPLPLRYTFDGDKLTLFGDPLLSKLQLELIKNKEKEYVLFYKSKYFSIDKTAGIKRLEELRTDSSFGNSLLKLKPKLNPSEERLNIVLEDITRFSEKSKNLKVSYDSESSSDAYFFDETDNTLELIINSNLNPETAKVYEVKEKTRRRYFLVEDTMIYELDVHAKEAKPLKQVEITKNKMARLFMEKASFETTVYKEK
ncbi:hypothetical protein [Flagellimonas sp. CMM7]|uniref:hypothetical protein n=1 Tax=Flagellimonas sp. CMM7 TaxID=2654676 RepID=UPI0013D649AC|nr:hypothetical protein [Flagellimonas sp. CMM7]UII81656.1 hypothetical protein LV704_09110 [Flagellimonas sp. CMM7]